MNRILPLLSALSFAASTPAGCIPVTGSRILGRDLALADPRFSALPATFVAGFTAGPGMKRILTASELQRIARANGLAIDHPEDLCFEFLMLRVKEEDAIAAMRRSLPPEAELNVVELASSPVPAGVLEFPLHGLDPPQPSAPGVQLWRGYVNYAENRKAAFWARVAIAVESTVVVAHKDLPSDSRIDAASLRLEKRKGPLQRQPAAARIEDVAGRACKQPVKAGSVIPLALLTEAPAVHRGDAVTVEVQSGPARLHFDAIAEASARAGELVDLRNPMNGKIFKARIDSPSKAVIVIGGGQL